MSTIKASTDLILSELKKAGSAIGNKTFISIFISNGLSEEDYYAARQKLYEDGQIQLGRGRGGSISLSMNPGGSGGSAGESKTELSIGDVKRMILQLVPNDGSTIGNLNLLKTLSRKKVEPESYWNARNELIGEGLLVKGRGMGGSVSLSEKAVPAKTPKKNYPKERDLYQPFEQTVRDFWTKDNNIYDRTSIVEITANQGGKRTGGKWTRPDLTIVSVNTFRFVPGRTLDVLTFEIKPANALDIVGVYETASHSRFAAKSYLSVHLPDGRLKSSESQMEVLLKECERFGIGFLYFKDPGNFETWETLLEPVRRTPDPSDVDSFISVQISKKNQDEIGKMIK